MNRSLALTLTLVLAISPRAESQSVREFMNFCTSGSIRTCASTRVETLWDEVAGVNRVNLMIRNLQGWLLWDNSLGSAITRVAISSPEPFQPRDLVVSTSGSATAVGTPSAYWGIRNWELEGRTDFLAMTSSGIVPSPVEGAIFGCSALHMVRPVNYFRTCGDGGWINFAFTSTQRWDAANVDIGWAVVKTNADGGAHLCRSDDPLECDVPPVTTTPEPATALLLGSGLAGLAALERRRRKHEQVAS